MEEYRNVYISGLLCVQNKKYFYCSINTHFVGNNIKIRDENEKD